MCDDIRAPAATIRRALSGVARESFVGAVLWLARRLLCDARMSVRPIVVSLFCALLLAPAWGARAKAPTLPVAGVAWIARAAAQAPDTAALHQAVLRHAHVSDAEPLLWTRDVRRAAWLPRLQVGLRKNVQQHYDLTLDDTASVTSSGVVIGPRTSNFSSVGDDRVQVDVRMLWSFGDLVFSADRLAISREARAQRTEARTVLMQANQALTLWVQATAVLLDMQAPRGGAAMARLQQLQAATVLEALSGGWFSQNLRHTSGE